jgi:hypothetical protein
VRLNHDEVPLNDAPMRAAQLLVLVLLTPLAASASFIDSEKKEINVKVVLFGPGTEAPHEALQYIVSKTDPETSSKLHHVGTEKDRVYFFDFVPKGIEQIQGHTLRIHLYATVASDSNTRIRQLTLEAADGVMFLATKDVKASKAALDTVRTALPNAGAVGDATPFALGAIGGSPIEELARGLGLDPKRAVSVDAKSGDGVFDALEVIVKQTLLALKSGENRGSATAAAANAKLPRVTGSGYSIPVPSGFSELRHSSVETIWKQGGVVLRQEQRPDFEDAFLASIVVTPVGAPDPQLETEEGCAAIAKTLAGQSKATLKKAFVTRGSCHWTLQSEGTPNRMAIGFVLNARSAWVVTCNLDARDTVAVSACATVDASWRAEPEN